MPLYVGNKGSFGCYGYPAIEANTNKVVGCHKTRNEAETQVDAHNRMENKFSQALDQKK